MNGTFDIWIQQGCTFSLTLTATDISGNPVNLSGYNVQGFVRYGYGDTGYLLNLSPTLDAFNTGQIDISVPYTGTTGLPITKGVYDIIATSGNYAFKVIRGYANITPENSIY